MPSDFKEPIPKSEYLLEIGDFILSAGKSFIYEIVSGPICRIYWQPEDDKDLSKAAKERLTFVGKGVALTPNKNESSWYDTGCPKKGWRRNGPNYPSYQVLVHDIDNDVRMNSEITLRWIPVKSNLSELKKYLQSKPIPCLTSLPQSTTIEISTQTLQRMSMLEMRI